MNVGDRKRQLGIGTVLTIILLLLGALLGMAGGSYLGGKHAACQSNCDIDASREEHDCLVDLVLELDGFTPKDAEITAIFPEKYQECKAAARTKHQTCKASCPVVF